MAPVNQNSPSSFDIANRTLISALRIPFGSALAITPDDSTVIVTDNSNNLFRILALSPDGLLTDTGNTVAYNFIGTTGGVVIAPNGHFALFTNRGNNTVAILRIDPAHNSSQTHNITLSGTPISICCQPFGAAFTPDGTKAYVTNSQSNDIAVLSIDAADNITDTGVRIAIPNGVISPGAGSAASIVPGIAIGLDGRAYISNTLQDSTHSQSTITIVDTTTDKVIGTVPVGLFPSGIGVPR